LYFKSTTHGPQLGTMFLIIIK